MYSVATKTQGATVSDKLLELRNRAIIRMNCADLRHTPNLHDITQANENAADLAKDQYKTIKE